MLLTDLKAGSAISFEITIGDSHYEFPSSIIYVYPDSILIPPFIRNGNVVNLGDKRFGNMTFTIYYADTGHSRRLAFKGVSVETVEHSVGNNTDFYYKIKSSGFAALAKISERRNTKRMMLDLEGSITLEDSERNINVMIHDISNSGVSFFCSQKLDSLSNSLYIFIRDTINSHDFDIRIKCKIIRYIGNDNIYLYGCSITETSREYQSYVCLKQSEAKYNSTHHKTDYVEENENSAGINNIMELSSDVKDNSSDVKENASNNGNQFFMRKQK